MAVDKACGFGAMQVYHLVSQSPACIVSVTVLETTSSSEHKVKNV